MKTKPLIVVGAGGHARVVLEALRSQGRSVSAFLDPAPALAGRAVDGIRVAGGDDKLADFPAATHDAAIGVGGARDTRLRRKVQAKIKAAGYALPPVVAASAVVSEHAKLAEGAQVLTRAVVHPGAAIGAGAVINTGALIEHDCSIGELAFVGPGAVVLGGASVGDGAFVGASAVILPGVRVGKDALVAAGAVVRADVQAGGRELGRERKEK